MNKDTKIKIKIVGAVNPFIIATQMEDYYPGKCKIIIIRKHQANAQSEK